MDDIKEIMQVGISILVDAVLHLLQGDPHQWSTRPCSTCKTITNIVGKPFGCYEYQRQRVKKEKQNDENQQANKKT